MKNRRKLLVLILVLGFLSVASADKKKCYSGCRGSGSFYKYEDGTNYKYKLEGSTITTVPGSQGDISKVSVTADVDISVQPQCSHILKVSNVQITGPDGKAQNSAELEAHPVKFSFHDGHIESEVCAEEGDSQSALNIKRAVISLLQSAIHKDAGVTSHVETDVFGTCPTDFEFFKSGNTLKIKKIRNLNHCAHRESLNFPVFSTAYNINSDFQSSPLIISSSKVEQVVQDGIVHSVVGEEKYSYQPHATVESGVLVTVKTKLSFVSQAKGAPIAANVVKPKSIIFDAPHETTEYSSVDAIQKALDQAEHSSETSVQPSAAQDFAELVEVLSHSKKADILGVFAGVKAKENAKNILIDGIARASTGEAVEVLAELAQANELSKLQKTFWYTSLGFIKHVTRGSLKAVAPLLNSGSRQAYLGVGSLAARYCSNHDCENDSEFKDLLSKIAEPISSGCKVDSVEKEDKIITSLKSLHNVHHLTNEVADKVSQCASDKGVKTRIRVAALETFQSDASKSKLKSSAIAILKNMEEDSEVRIKAYLALVECPCNKVADTVKNVLENEQVNQVGSFITSHLRNLRASANPDKAAAKHFLSQIHVNKKFPVDIRKFSHNQEVSYSIDALNLGAAGEQNVIFSEKSYIPRSYSLNLTSQIFGHAFNFIEFNARTENLDYIFEKYFGPKGYFPAHDPKDIYDNAIKHATLFKQKIADKYQETIRPKRDVHHRHPRDVSQLTHKFADKVDLGIDSHDSDLDLDLSLKLYGAEVAWLSYHGNNKKVNADNIINKAFESLDESFEKAKNLDVNFKKHTTFLDAEAIYPTGLGLPLKLNTKGSSAVSVKLDGKFDIPAIVKDPKNAYIKFQVIPSASIELSGQLSVDAFVVESGVKVFGTIHSATGSDLSIRFIDGLGVDAKFGLPIKKQDIVSFNSNIVSITKGKGHPKTQAPVKFDTKRHEYNGCFDQLSSLLGLTFCGKVSYPFDSHKLLSPAYGPSSLSLHIEKEDESLTTYNFKAQFNNKEPNLRSLEILLDTPNSKSNRKLRFLGTAGSQPKQITAIINTPWKDLSFDGRITDTDKEHTVSAKLLDDTTEYSIKAGVYVSGDENHKTFKPLLEYKVPEFKTKSTGLVGVKGGKGAKGHHGVAVAGLIKLDKNSDSGYRKYTLEGVTISTPSKTYKVDGTVGHDVNLLETDLKASYEKESITLKSNLKKDFSDAGKKLKVYVETAFTEQPDFNFVLDWEYSRDKASVGNIFSLIHGPNPKSEDHKITINQYLAYQYENLKSFHFNTKNSLSYPLVALSGNVNGESTPNSIDYDLKGVYDKYHISSSLKANTGVNKPGDYNVNFKGQVLDNSLDFHAKREIVSDVKSKFTNSLEIKPGGVYQANAVINHSFKKDNFHNSIHANFKFPAEPKEVKLEAGLKITKKEFESEFEVAAGDKKYVEFKVEFEKNKPSGKFVANLPPNFSSNGHYKFENNKGAGAFVFHFPKQDRKIEGNSELTASGSKYVGFADIAWDATKHPEKKIRVETDSEFSKVKIDSKNSFIYKGDQKTQFNFKRIINSLPAEESLISEAELVLPSGRTFASSYNGKYTHQSDDYDGEVDFKFTDFLAPGQLSHKVGFKLNAKNINPAKRTIDGQVQLSYANGAGKDANIQAALKKILSGERWTISTSGSVTGSLPPYPVNFKFDSEVSEQFLNCRLADDHSLPFGTYNLIFTAGELSFNGNGKVNQHQVNNEIDLKLPHDYSISTLKWVSTNQYTPNEKIKSSNAINWNGDKFFKTFAEGVKEQNGVSGKLEWESHLKSARTVTANAHYVPNAEGDKKIDAALNFAYEGNVANVNLNAKYEKKSDIIQVDLSGSLPQQGKFDVSVKNQVVNDGKGFQTDVILNVNEKKITVTNHVVLDKENPLIDLAAEHPQGKSRVLFKIEKKGDRHYIGESKVKWVGNGGGNLAIDGEAKLDSVEDFIIKLTADSPKLNIENYHFEVGNKPTKTSAQKITFVAKSADKTLFAGSSSYNFKDEGDSKIIDGSGTIKFDDKQYPLNFKYVRNILSETDGETGNQVKINVKFGKNVYDVLGKLTTTTFILRRTFTKETGETSKAEISSKIKKYSVAEYDYEFNVILNKILKDAEDLSLKIVTKRNGFILDHNFELQRSPDSKIKYHLYVHENQAGAVLTLPKRVVAAEAKYDIPTSKDKGILQAEAALWLNKQQAPTEKTAIAVNAEMNKIGEGGSFNGEVKVTHPALGKDLVVSGHATILQQWNKLIDGKIEFDIFAKKDQKITVDYKSVRNKEKDGYTVNQNLRIKGAAIDVDYKSNAVASKSHLKYAVQFVYVDSQKAKKESKALFDVSPTKLEYLVKIPEGTLLSVKSVLKESGNQYNLENLYEILGEKYSESIEIKNQNNIKYAFIFDKGGKEKKLTADFGFNIGQVAEYNVNFDGKELSYVQVALDDGNFLKSKYSYKTDTFKHFIEVAKEDYVGAVKRVSKSLQEAINRVSKDIVHQVEEAQKSLPNFGAVVKAYTEQIEALRQEVVNEKSIQEAADYIKGTLSVILEQVVTVLEEVAKAVESLVTIFNEAAAKISEAIKKLAPKLTEGYEKIAKIVVHLFEESLKYSVEVFNYILDKIKDHEEEIQVIVNATTEFLSEIGQLAAKVIVQFKGQIKEFVELFIEQIKALPVFSMIKEKFEELKAYEIPQQTWDDFHLFVGQVKEALPTPELSQFFGTLASYAEKIVRQKDISAEDFKTLYKEFVAALKSIVAFVRQHVPQEKFVQPSLVPLPTFTIWKIPKGAFRFSPISWLQSPDLPSVSEVLYTYKPTINPIDYIPPYKGVGYLISSSEFFTFNQRHITFKGNCLYVLAQDFVDGNFSIAAKIENGKVKSIIVVDQKDSVELVSDGSVQVNGAPSEYPVVQGDIRAWRRYPTSNIYSKAGVIVHCSTDLEFCSFHVSGFYFGKTRGLLGRLNNEQYKDFTLPSGKIASSVSDFVNAYKLNSCGDIAAPDTTHDAKDPHCTDLFSSDSSFRFCFPGVNPHHYRHACNLITAEAPDKKSAACKVANAYHTACANSGIRVPLPSDCIQCSIGGKTVEAYDSVEVKTPQNKADVVIVVEQVEENEEVFNQLVTPLVNQLTKDFNAKGINDVHLSLIGFGAPNMKWPQHYTTNGKIDFNGKSTIYFTKKAAPEKSEDDYYHKLKNLKHKFDIEIGNTQIYLAFHEANQYPFRPDAVKSIIGVLGGPCETSGLPVSLQHARLFLHYIFNKITGVQFNLITNIHNLEHVSKDDKQAAPVTDVVGLSKERVYFLNGAKDENPSHYKHDSDVCVTFTLASDGIVYNSGNFKSAKADSKKQFLHEVSGSLVDNLTSKHVEYKCSCIEKDGLPKTECIVIDASETESLEKYTKKGVKGVKG